MGKWSQVSAGSDRALFRDNRMNTGVEKSHEKLQKFDTHAAEALSENIGAQQKHGARFRFAKRVADTTGVAAHKIDLQLSEFVWSDAHVGQLAKSGIDAVNGFSCSEDLLDESSTLAHALLRSGRDCDRSTGDGDRLDLRKRERLAVEGESFHAKMVGLSDEGRTVETAM